MNQVAALEQGGTCHRTHSRRFKKVGVATVQRVKCLGKLNDNWNDKKGKRAQSAVGLLHIILKKDGDHDEVGSIRDVPRACCAAEFQHGA